MFNTIGPLTIEQRILLRGVALARIEQFTDLIDPNDASEAQHQHLQGLIDYAKEQEKYIFDEQVATRATVKEIPNPDSGNSEEDKPHRKSSAAPKR